MKHENKYLFTPWVKVIYEDKGFSPVISFLKALTLIIMAYFSWRWSGSLLLEK